VKTRRALPASDSNLNPAHRKSMRTATHWLTALWLGLWLLTSQTIWAQSGTITGTVTDGESGEGLYGVQVKVKDKLIGTYTKADGSFSLTLNTEETHTLVFSYIGYASQEVQVGGGAGTAAVTVSLLPEGVMGAEVVVSASRVNETIMEAPISIELVDIQAVKNTSALNFYDALAHYKSVDFVTVSLNFKTINTRGFNSGGNTRFVQRIDGMDVQAPGLNLPLGTIVAPPDIDIASAELIPGAASALYGPNAFNGLLDMHTKSPFDYPGLSVQLRTGANHLDGIDHKPSLYNDGAIRWAQTLFNDRFGYKVTFSFFNGTDWYASDTQDVSLLGNVGLRGTAQNPGRDGLNIYGDEINANLPIGPGGEPINVSRTGYLEQDVVDYNTKTYRVDAGMYYRINDKMQASYQLGWGSGTTVYHAANRYSLRNFTYNRHKIELSGKNWFARAYRVGEGSGESYDARFLAINLNRAWKPDEQWFSEYGAAFLGQINGVQANDHAAARAFADQGRLLPGTPEFQQEFERIRSLTDFRVGARFDDATNFWHAEGQYDFNELITWADISVGGSYRIYDLQSNGTIFPDTAGNNITISEFGGFAQITKRLIDDRLRLTGSIRYDKNENFQGQFSPRILATFKLKPEHVLRASFQTGFRMPTTQDMFIDLDVGPIQLVGGLPIMWDRYDLTTRTLYTLESVQAFGDSVVAAGSTPQAVGQYKSILQRYEMKKVKPERVYSWEIGYKGRVGGKLFYDVAWYYSRYEDFMGNARVIRTATNSAQDPEGNTAVFDITSGNFRPFQLYVNATDVVFSQGFAGEISYQLPRNFTVGGNYTWAKLILGDSEDPIIPAFNTPEHKFNLKFANPKLTKHMGFQLNFRWQDAYRWESSFANGDVPSFHTLDAQVSYRVPAWYTVFKLGSTNLYNNRHVELFGGPTIGSMVYLMITFDEFLNRQ
jgi:outer membrane receptor protein involved in Fe transport